MVFLIVFSCCALVSIYTINILWCLICDAFRHLRQERNYLMRHSGIEL